MNNKGKHIDDLFRQNMEDFREMPSNRVWEGVVDALDQQKKKRRFIIWFWMGGLGFAASVILTFFILNPINKTESLNTEYQAQKTEKTTTEAYKPVDKRAYKNVEAQAKNDGRQLILGNGKQTNPTQENTNSGFNGAKTPTKQVQRNIIKNEPNPNLIVPVENKTVQTNPITIEKSDGITVLPLEKEPVANIFIPTEEMQLAIHPVETYESPAAVLICPSAPPRFRATIGVYGYAGGVAYQRIPSNASSNGTITNNNDSANKRFGLYAAAAIKAGFIHRSGIYMNIGIGYEAQRFVTNQQFNLSLTPSNGVTSDQQDIPSVYTSFGEVGIPFNTEGFQNAAPETMKGKLLYQSHHLFLPVDFGYSFQFKRFGLDLGTSAAFHIPLSQKAIFYPEEDETRELITSEAAAFNFSVGFEPSVRYGITPRLSIIAGGTFRYHILNAYRGTSSISRPYVLAGNFGLKYIISK